VRHDHEILLLAVYIDITGGLLNNTEHKLHGSQHAQHGIFCFAADDSGFVFNIDIGSDWNKRNFDIGYELLPARVRTDCCIVTGFVERFCKKDVRLNISSDLPPFYGPGAMLVNPGFQAAIGTTV